MFILIYIFIYIKQMNKSKIIELNTEDLRHMEYDYSIISIFEFEK